MKDGNLTPDDGKPTIEYTKYTKENKNMAKGLNAAQVLANINACIDELTAQEKVGANRNYNRYIYKL